MHWFYDQERSHEFWGENLIRKLSGISLPFASLRKPQRKCLLYFTAFDIKSYFSTIGTFPWEFLREADGSGILLIVIGSDICLRIREIFLDLRINVIFLWKLLFRNNFITLFSLPSTTYMAVDLSRALKLLKSISN